MTITKSIFGYIQEQPIYKFTLYNSNQNTVEILNYGGIVHRWLAPDSHGTIDDILLGCKTIEDYQERHPYFGAIVGRYANRIAYGKFTIDDTVYQLATNLPPHHLHGGNQGLDRKIWEAEVIDEATFPKLKLSTFSPDMEEGFPGNLMISVTYSLDEHNNLSITYQATSDQQTPINLTNHCYFDLSSGAENNILGHHLMVHSTQVLDVNRELIPTGIIKDISGTILDFSKSSKIADLMDVTNPMMENQKGLDHCYMLNHPKIEKIAASLICHTSGRRLQVFTTEPSIQIYTGNWLSGVSSRNGLLDDYQGICLETQHYPDSPNHAHFPSTILLSNEPFHSKTIYKVDCIKN